ARALRDPGARQAGRTPAHRPDRARARVAARLACVTGAAVSHGKLEVRRGRARARGDPRFPRARRGGWHYRTRSTAGGPVGATPASPSVAIGQGATQASP